MKAEETRVRLIAELEAQFSGAGATTVVQSASKNAVLGSVIQYAPKENVTNMSFLDFDKPKMFIPKDSGRLEMQVTETIPAVRGIGFKDAGAEETTLNILENHEIYSMKELIDKNPENMQTFSYDESVMKTQLALVKKKEWHDLLFEDIDWFKNIDLLSGIKRLFNRFYK